jgi:hypothetical protein
MPASSTDGFKFIRPVPITEDILQASSIVEDDYFEWNSASTYAAGIRVIRVDTHKIYESLSTNTNAVPEQNAAGLTPSWLEIGSTNTWRMFDYQVGTQSESADSFVVTLKPGRVVNSLALLNISATSLQIEILDQYGAVTSSTLYDLLESGAILDWYSFFYAESSYRTDFVITDLASSLSGSIRITFNNPGSIARCGVCVIGNYYTVGGGQYGATFGIIDYSVKNKDAFGNYSIIERSFSKRMNVNVECDNSIIDTLGKLLATYRASPIVWIGADNLYSSLIVYGFYKDFEVNIAYPMYSICSLQIEGLT